MVYRPIDRPPGIAPPDTLAAAPVRARDIPGRDAPENAQDAAPGLSPDAQATIAALRSALAAVTAERDALQAELNERNATTAAFLALLERRQRAREQEHGRTNSSPDRGTLH